MDHSNPPGAVSQTKRRPVIDKYRHVKRYQEGNCRRCGHANPDLTFATCPTCRAKMAKVHQANPAPRICIKCGKPRPKFRETCAACARLPRQERTPEQKEAFNLFISALIKEFNYQG